MACKSIDRLWNEHDFTSVRARCVFGVLKYVSSSIVVSVERLDWIIDNKILLAELCKCVKAVLRNFSFQEGNIDTFISEFMKRIDCSETKTFLVFCQNLRTCLQKWKDKVAKQNVTVIDVEHLRKHQLFFNTVCELSLLENACIDDEEVHKLGDICEALRNQLSDLLIQSIPSHPELKW